MVRILSIVTYLSLPLFLLLFFTSVTAADLIEPTRTLDQDGSLPPGTLNVLSEPPGSEVSLNGEVIGQTPILGKTVDAGIYSLRVNEQQEEIHIESGKILQVSLFKGEFIQTVRSEKEAKMRGSQESQPSAAEEPKESAKDQPEQYGQENWQFFPGRMPFWY